MSSYAQQVGKRLKAARTELHWTQSAVMSVAGWPGEAFRLELYEKGERLPNLNSILQLAKTLGKTPEYLAFGIRS